MKKTMKTMLSIVAGVLCLAGCAKEDAFKANGAKFETLFAYQEGEYAAKAAIDGTDSKAIDWTAGDKINYFGGATGESMTLSAGAGTTSGTFEGTVTHGSTDYVLYPYQTTATCSAGVILAEVPMTQYAVANSFDPAAALMVGVVNGASVEFKNVMSYVKVTIPSDMNNCKQVSIKAKDAWTTVAGKVNITASTGAWAETTAKEGQAFVRLVPTSPATTLKAGESYYIAILPQDMSAGFELIFNDNDVIKVKQSASSSVVFSRNMTKMIAAITDFTYTVDTIEAGTLIMADRNIGAATAASTDYGDYFAFAALRPAYTNKTPLTWYKAGGFSRANASYYNGSAYTKYLAEGDKLDVTDDIAAMLWGGNWRIPTGAEWEANISDSKVKSLPCGGSYDKYGDGTVLCNTGEAGAYWASTITSDNLMAQFLLNQIIPFPMSYVAAEGRQAGRNVRPILDAPAVDSNLLAGEFSVSATKKVKFTRGNLYWNGSAFQIEANQTDYPTTWGEGDEAGKHVGHFYWTNWTDYKSNVAAYMPYASSYSYSNQSTEDEFWCSEAHKLTVAGTSDLYVLSGSEWQYLQSRKSGLGIRNWVSIAGKNCAIIVPDDVIGTYSFDYDKETYTAEEWALAESAGFVCLPASGIRPSATTIQAYNNVGMYWRATATSIASRALDVMFRSDQLSIHGDDSRQYGMAIRLVKTVE